MMNPRVVDATHLTDYQLEIRFSDGLVATLDFGTRIRGRGGMFEALQQVEEFARVTVDREAGTLAWPNGVDFCPDVLYAEATGKDVSDLGNGLDVA